MHRSHRTTIDMSRQSSLLSFMPKRRCIVDEPEESSEDEGSHSHMSVEASSQSRDETTVQPAASTPSTSSAACTSFTTAVPDDIALTPTSSPSQQINHTFPERAYSDKERSFNPQWYKQYSWLEYLIEGCCFLFPLLAI